MSAERVIAEISSGESGFRVCMPARSVLILELTGNISEELGLQFVEALDHALRQSPGLLTVFADLRKMEGYRPSLRLQLVATFLAHSDLVPSIHAYAHEEFSLILMAVAVANIALGERITMHPEWADFERRLKRAIEASEGW